MDKGGDVKGPIEKIIVTRDPMKILRGLRKRLGHASNKKMVDAFGLDWERGRLWGGNVWEDDRLIMTLDELMTLSRSA